MATSFDVIGQRALSVIDDYKYVLDMYKTASDAQKKIIVDTIVSKRSNGEYVDANIMIKLGELCGRDLVGITSLDNEE